MGGASGGGMSGGHRDDAGADHHDLHPDTPSAGV
jgi:hypothetical protein